jgi:hypothetical protein
MQECRGADEEPRLAVEDARLDLAAELAWIDVDIEIGTVLNGLDGGQRVVQSEE